MNLINGWSSWLVVYCLFSKFFIEFPSVASSCSNLQVIFKYFDFLRLILVALSFNIIKDIIHRLLYLN